MKEDYDALKLAIETAKLEKKLLAEKLSSAEQPTLANPSSHFQQAHCSHEISDFELSTDAATLIASEHDVDPSTLAIFARMSGVKSVSAVVHPKFIKAAKSMQESLNAADEARKAKDAMEAAEKFHQELALDKKRKELLARLAQKRLELNSAVGGGASASAAVKAADAEAPASIEEEDGRLSLQQLTFFNGKGIKETCGNFFSSMHSATQKNI